LKRFAVILLAAAAAAAGCSPAARPAATAAPPTPTPSIGRVNPYVVEETDTYVIERLPKKEYIRVDDRHIRHPVVAQTVEFFKEDDEYYYVKTQKYLPEEAEAQRQAQERINESMPRPSERAEALGSMLSPPAADYESVAPERTAARFRLEELVNSGLPDDGLWRASFAIADMNGDGIPDIVAPPSRLAGDTKLRIWLGDGHGHFTPWKLRFFDDKGKEVPEYGLDYGGVAVGDLDGDGKLDVVVASHGRGIVALFGDGKGTFTASRKGFLGNSFSTQAVTLADVNGDGKLDVIASADHVESSGEPWNREQAHLYLNLGNRTFKRKADGLYDASLSNSVTAWDCDGDGRADVLIGSNYFAAVQLLFHNNGNGTLTPVNVPDVEIWAYHFALAPGTFGKDRAPAFADLFYKGSYLSADFRAAGINVHVYRKGKWEKHVVWREKGSQAVLRTLAFGDVDGDGLDDIVFPDTVRGRLRIFLQQADGKFKEAEEKDEPAILPVAQHVKLVDLNGDGRLDVVLAKTIEAPEPKNQGGWSVFLNSRVK
jgi:FG-GAP-like repeat